MLPWARSLHHGIWLSCMPTFWYKNDLSAAKGWCECCVQYQLPDRASKLGHVAAWLSGSWEVWLTSIGAVLHFAAVNEGKNLYFGQIEGVSIGGLMSITENPVSWLLECGSWKCSEGSTQFPVSCLPLSASHTSSFPSGRLFLFVSYPSSSSLLRWAWIHMVSSVILYLGHLNLNSIFLCLMVNITWKRPDCSTLSSQEQQPPWGEESWFAYNEWPNHMRPSI